MVSSEIAAILQVAPESRSSAGVLPNQDQGNDISLVNPKVAKITREFRRLADKGG
jgi:hypothetical protein